MTYKLLITDLDGTLLDAHGRVHDRDRRAIAALLARGVRVSLCTGRMYSGSRDIARELDLNCPVGCVDGSHIVNPRNDGELVLKSIGCEAARELCTALNQHRPVTFVFADDTLHHDEHGAEFLSYVMTWSRCTRRLDDVIAERRWYEEGCISGLVAIGNEAQILGVERFVRERLADRLQVAAFEIRRIAVTPGTWGMVVRAAGASKGTALEWIARYEKIAPDEVVAVGDWLNDVPMLRAAGLSFAMAQAPEEVAEAASERLEADHTTGGGIEEAAERAGLL